MAPDTKGDSIEIPGDEPVAAEPYDGDKPCQYGCGDTADWLVEVELGSASTLMWCCDACQSRNVIHVQANELERYDISEEVLR